MRRALAIAALMLVVPASASAEIGGTRSDVPQVGYFWDVGPHDGLGALCSATLVRPRLVLTAAHCIAPHSVVMLRIGGRSYECRRIAIDPQYASNRNGHDLAFLRLSRRSRVAPWPVGLYVLNRPAFSYGWGMPNTNVQTEATYVPTVALPWVLSASSQPGESLGEGDSGGPLVQGGQVVGVNEGTYGPGQPQWFAYIDQWAWDHIAAGR